MIYRGRIEKWLLFGGAFAAMACVAGCTASMSILQYPPTATSAPVAKASAANTRSQGAPYSIAPTSNAQPASASHAASTADRTTAQSGPDSAEASRPQFAFAPHAAVPGAPATVNVFGELDGVDLAAPTAHADAGFEQHTFVNDGYDADAAVDPTGKWIVFSSTRHSEHPNLYLQRVDGQAVVQLTNDETDHATPAFSPAGKQIAFSARRGGAWNLFLMDVDGRNVIQLTSGLSQDVHPSFSPGGNKLVYSSLGAKGGQWELWVIDLATGEKKMIGYGLFPAWSPLKSADRIAFQRARQRGSRWFSVWTLDLVDGEARKVTEVAVSPSAAVVSPAWSTDGSKLAVATIVEPPAVPGVKPQGREDIWAMDADGSNRRRLTDGNGSNLTPFWAADDRIFFVSDRGGNECVWSVKAPGATSVTADSR